MLGIIIVNASNDILHSFGNSGFVNHVQSLVCHNLVEITSTNKFYSSSSGVSSCESSVKDAPYISKINKCDDSALLDMILPLLALYQSKQDTSDDEYNFVYSDNCKYFFEAYDPSHYVVGIASETYSENEVKQLVLNVKHLVEFYYGPFIHFLRADLSSVKRKKSRVEKRVNALIQQVDQGTLKYPMLNINALLANGNQFRAYTTLFRKIVQEIGNAIGACRCLFVSGGQLLASASTRTKHSIPIYDLIDPNDINNLIILSQMLENNANKDDGSSRKRLQHHIEQVWVHFPKAGHRRQLVNAFLFSLSGEVDLICVSAVDHSGQIHVLSDLVDLLETVESVTIAEPFVDKCASLIDIVCRELAHFTPKYASKEGQFVFLENSQRTVTLIKNLWGRLRLEILRASNDDIRLMSKRPSMMTLWSASQSPMSTIHRWSSTASLFSSASSQQSLALNVNKVDESKTLKHMLPVQTHAMIKHFQRQLRFILNELCLHSTISAKLDKFKFAEGGMQKAMDKNSNKSLVPLFRATARHLFDAGSIAPAKLGYDMLGYVFYRLDAPFNLSSYPDAFARLFLHAQSSPISSELTIVRLESGHLFVQIMGKVPEKSTTKVKKSKTPKDESVFDFPVSCCAVFPEMVNSQLAIKQTIDLAFEFNIRVDKILLMFE